MENNVSIRSPSSPKSYYPKFFLAVVAQQTFLPAYKVIKQGYLVALALIWESEIGSTYNSIIGRSKSSHSACGTVLSLYSI